MSGLRADEGLGGSDAPTRHHRLVKLGRVPEVEPGHADVREGDEGSVAENQGRQ